MEEAKRVKNKTLYSAEKSRVEVKVLKKIPGKTVKVTRGKASLPGTSKTKGIKNKSKADKVATSEEETTKPEDTKIVKTTKNTSTRKEAKDTKAENKLEAIGTAEKTKGTGAAKKTKGTGTAKKTKDTGTAKKTKDTGAAKKTKEDTEKLNTTAGTSRMKVPNKSKAENNIQKTEVTDKKLKLMDEVYEAITINGEPKKGATSQAIKSYIFNKRGIENEDANSHKRMNALINRALRKGVEKGDLERPANRHKGTAVMVSALGRFVLPKKVTKPKISKKPEVEEDSETME